MTTITRAVHLRRVLVCIEGHADRTVADRVDLDLEARAVEVGHRAIQFLLGKHRDSVAAADVRLEHVRRLRVHRAVQDGLRESIRDQRVTRRVTQRGVLRNLLCGHVDLERQRRAVANRHRALFDGAHDRGTLVLRQSDIGRVLQRGQPQRRGGGQLLKQQIVSVVDRKVRQQPRDQRRGRFLQQPRRLTVRAAADQIRPADRVCHA